MRRWAELGELRLCYEASGGGYVLKHWLDAERVHCKVIAPLTVPRQAGKRIKTDRRDARTLARQYAGGLLSVVRTPSVVEERARVVVRLHDELTPANLLSYGLKMLTVRNSRACRLHS